MVWVKSAFLFSPSAASFLKKPALSAALVCDQDSNAFLAALDSGCRRLRHCRKALMAEISPFAGLITSLLTFSDRLYPLAIDIEFVVGSHKFVLFEISRLLSSATSSDA